MNAEMNESIEYLERCLKLSKSFRGGKAKTAYSQDDMPYHYRAVKAAKWMLKMGLLEEVEKLSNGEVKPLVRECLWLVEGGWLEYVNLHQHIIQIAHRRGWKEIESSKLPVIQ